METVYRLLYLAGMQGIAYGRIDYEQVYHVFVELPEVQYD